MPADMVRDGEIRADESWESRLGEPAEWMWRGPERPAGSYGRTSRRDECPYPHHSSTLSRLSSRKRLSSLNTSRVMVPS